MRLMIKINVMCWHHKHDKAKEKRTSHSPFRRGDGRQKAVLDIRKADPSWNSITKKCD
jgi:hypothetical protein